MGDFYGVFLHLPLKPGSDRVHMPITQLSDTHYLDGKPSFQSMDWSHGGENCVFRQYGHLNVKQRELLDLMLLQWSPHIHEPEAGKLYGYVETETTYGTSPDLIIWSEQLKRLTLTSTHCSEWGKD